MLLQERKETENLKQKIETLDKEKTAQYDLQKFKKKRLQSFKQKISRLESDLTTQKQAGQYAQPGIISSD